MRPMPLVCLPFAGAGASVYRLWTPLSDGELDVIPVQLPGREDRIDEEPYRDVGKAVDEILPEVLARLSGRGEAALFGHSMGAVLAYELAHALADRAGVRIALLVASGSHGPWDIRGERVSHLTDEEFLRSVHRFAGYRPPALEDPDFREMMLPVLRADAEMHEGYVPSSDFPLPAPILTVRGAEDAVVSAAETGQWSRASAHQLRSAELPGGHMYLTESPETLLRLIVDVVKQSAGPA
ncbi:thioesterase II family protein [Streptomyces goshikiensis]|uniref:thioesterase II family protein n=1 Tax=Streptomyces goshikiensis TaxID=1942 RepID=UPI0036A33498